MTDPSKAERVSDDAKEVRAVIEDGVNIRAEVRKITLEALKRGQLDSEGVKRVVRSVLHGASLGVADAGDRSRQALSEALDGIDEALAKSAEATRLAVEEASGRLRSYGKQDLESALADMRVVESMLLDTLKEVAENSADAAREIMQGLWQHAKNNGTTAGATASETIKVLEQRLGQTLREVSAAGSEAALNASSALAEATAGFLSGLADTLDAKAKSLKKNQNK